jgi:hypothetical protein
MNIPFDQTASVSDEVSARDELSGSVKTPDASDPNTESESIRSIRSANRGQHEQVEKHKFVGRSREREDILKTMSPRRSIEPPAEVLRWSEVLGLDASNLTAEDIHRAWRKAISSPDVHPDLGGEVETAILLNTAKDSLTKWLDSFAPKLGKQFLNIK